MPRYAGKVPAVPYQIQTQFEKQKKQAISLPLPPTLLMAALSDAGTRSHCKKCMYSSPSPCWLGLDSYTKSVMAIL